MNTLITSNTIEPSETTEGREYAPEASMDAAQPSSNGSRLRNSRLTRPDDNSVRNDETAYPNTDECTYETDEVEETEEAEESQESEELQEKQELATPDPTLWGRIGEAISECRVSNNRDINRPLFILANRVRSIEEELSIRFSVDVTAEIVRRWKAQNHDRLDDNRDYLTEFLDKLSLVRYPRGRALARAVEIARSLVPSRRVDAIAER